MPQKIIIDTDIGTYYDDALAVLLGVRSPELDVLGVTTVYGDTELRSSIARKVLNVAGRPDVPVYTGIGQPMRGNSLMFGFEGEGVFDNKKEQEKLKANPGHAVNFIIKSVMENPGQVTIVTLGAVSNLAMAVLMEPKLKDNVKDVIIMGGVIVPIVDQKGIRRSPVEEYNLNNDTTAAQIVFESGLPITLCPIDVTLKVPITNEQLGRINKSSDPVAKLVSSILGIWPPQERLIYLSVGIPTEHTGLWMHDPLTVALAFDKSFCEITRLHVAAEFAPTPIERDLIVRNDILRTIPKKRPANMDLCVDVDVQRFTELFTERMCAPVK